MKQTGIGRERADEPDEKNTRSTIPVMCGLVGKVGQEGTDRGELSRAITTMSEHVRHRGPDASGQWINEKQGVGLGLQRLAILDSSAAGAQPMTSPSGRYTCAFNGEIYNHQELRRELAQKGYCFKGKSDTEVLVKTIEVHGTHQGIRKLRGMFAIATWDRTRNELVVARDRMGEKPLHVAETARGEWLVSSELKAFTEANGFARQVNTHALWLYLQLGYVPAPHTIYEHAYKIRPGTLETLRYGRERQVETYWSACQLAERNAGERETVRDDEAAEELEAQVNEAVEEQMVADVPIGALLSGGIDSSTITALMQSKANRRTRTFTIGFETKEHDESAHARNVAQSLGTEHTELRITGADAADVIPEMARIYDEPLTDISQVPTVMVSRLARRDVKVVLSGDGGDEVFGGYNHYSQLPRLAKAVQLIPQALRGASGRLLSKHMSHWLRTICDATEADRNDERGARQLARRLEKLGRLIGDTKEADDVYWNAVGIWRREDRILQAGLTNNGGRVGATNNDQYARIRDFRERMSLYDMNGFLANGILVKTDRASMSTGLEVRAPLLDHRLVEWALRLPAETRYRKGTPKWLLRRILDRHVPRAITDRPKWGFIPPIRQWLRKELRDWAEGLLTPDRIEAVGLDRTEVLRAWNGYLKGRESEQRAWAALVAAAWHQENVRQA